MARRRLTCASRAPPLEARPVGPPQKGCFFFRLVRPDVVSWSKIFYSDTQVSAAVGTPAFLAPEIARGGKARGKPSDVWSLGVTLFYIVCGQLPFLGETVAHVIKVGLWW